MSSTFIVGVNHPIPDFFRYPFLTGRLCGGLKWRRKGGVFGSVIDYFDSFRGTFEKVWPSLPGEGLDPPRSPFPDLNRRGLPERPSTHPAPAPHVPASWKKLPVLDRFSKFYRLTRGGAGPPRARDPGPEGPLCRRGSSPDFPLKDPAPTWTEEWRGGGLGCGRSGGRGGAGPDRQASRLLPLFI